MMTELVDEHVISEGIVRSHSAVEIEDAAATVGPIVCDDLNKFIGRKSRSLTQSFVVEREHVPLRAKGIVSRTQRRVVVDAR